MYFDNLGFAAGLSASLTGPDGYTAFDDDYGIGNQDQGTYTLPVAGTYTLTVLGSESSYYNIVGATGSYAFDLSDVSTAPALATGSVVSGTLATGLTTDIYQLSGTAGEVVYFEGLKDVPSNGAWAELLGPQDGTVTSFWLENDAQATLPYTGTYVLAIMGQSGSNSSVAYSFEAFAGAVTTASLPMNTAVNGTLAHPGDQAVYTFTGSIGQQIQFNGLTSGSGAVATLYDPEGHALDDTYVGDDFGPLTLAMPGTCSLVITTDGRNTGPFAFRLLDLAATTKLQVNTTEADLTVTLSAPSSQQVLVQYATADDTATLADGDYKPATGLILFQPGQTTATIEVQALDRFTTETTDFLVNLSDPVGATIAQGTGVVTVIGNGQATINGEVYNDVNGNGSQDGNESGLQGWTVELLDGSGNLLASTTTDTNGAYQFTGLAAGTYTVAEVVQPGYAQTAPAAPGTFSVTLRRRPDRRPDRLRRLPDHLDRGRGLQRPRRHRLASDRRPGPFGLDGRSAQWLGRGDRDRDHRRRRRLRLHGRRPRRRYDPGGAPLRLGPDLVAVDVLGDGFRRPERRRREFRRLPARHPGRRGL